MKNPTLLYVMGATNAGKSTLLRSMGETFGDRVALVEVGKMMRAKYLDPESPDYRPDYFKGQAAPTHTQSEAWEMHLRGIADGVRTGAEMIIVDGQPRDVPQVNGICGSFCGGSLRYHFDDQSVEVQFNTQFLLLHCDHGVRERRLRERFPNLGHSGPDQEGYALGVQRMNTDYRSLYDTIAALLVYDHAPVVLNTTDMVGVDGLERMRGVCPTIFDMYTG